MFDYIAEAGLTRRVAISAGRRGISVLLYLLQRSLYARESSCLVSRLPPWRDVAAESDAAVLLGAVYYCSLPPCLQNFGQSALSFSRSISPVLVQILDIFPPS